MHSYYSYSKIATLAIEHNYTEQVIAIAIANHLRLATGNTEWITIS